MTLRRKSVNLGLHSTLPRAAGLMVMPVTIGLPRSGPTWAAPHPSQMLKMSLTEWRRERGVIHHC